jgi:hypothetical protein
MPKVFNQTTTMTTKTTTNMKKQLLLILMTLLPMVASADAVEINGIYYNLVSKIQEAEVTSNPNQYTGQCCNTREGYL